MQFLNNLEKLMAEKNMNKSDLARACGLSTSTVNSWWNRSCENISLPTIMKIARYFNVTIEELVNAPAQKELVFSSREYSLDELSEIQHYAKFLRDRRKDVK